LRLDKFLKVSRLIKRRTVAKEICDAGRIEVNGRVAKAGSEVNVGDLITIHYGQKTTEVRVLQLAETARKDAADQMYEVVRESTHQTP
jgi:ribosomal 50S subunit-recycling heat shock protein